MASFAATENCFLDQSCDDLNVDELLNIDTSMIMSLLEDLQAEDGDGDVLRALVQSLRPEIMNQDSCTETCSSDDSSEECRFSEVDEIECCSNSTSLDHHPNYEWIDMEMDYYSCPGYEMTDYFTENMVEFGGLEDYSQVCNGMAMEEDDYIGLWQ